MKKIYIVLTKTGTILSKLIKLCTKDNYTHVSIALDYELIKMYSFGRLNAYNPFWAGFVQEGIKIGTFKRFTATQALIYEIEVTYVQYEKIQELISEFEKEKKKYKFNIMGILLASINKSISRKYKYYCAEFVKYILIEANIVENLPKIIKPIDFEKIENVKLVYQGLLKDYTKGTE